MTVRFANSYVEQLFAERDLPKLYHLISVVSDDRDLPEEFWLFNRLLEWTGSTRSGVWQYYESLPADTYTRMTRALEQFDLTEISEQYQNGYLACTDTHRATTLDEWIDAHEGEIQEAAFQLISLRKDVLLIETR